MRTSILLILFLLISCKEEHFITDFERTLAVEEDRKVWCFEALEDNHYTFVRYNQFFSDKTYQWFGGNMDLYETVNLDGNENFESKWSFNETDSIFSLGYPEMEYKLLSYTKDTVFLIGNNYEGNFRMTRMLD
ncbi:hypothetical protein [Flavobacterium alkalisoli]|uniref:hypothetical protein n=1 Tax=Flavobacterium alkalisoli TaxID=2602769 RepID=UPI003A952E90